MFVKVCLGEMEDLLRFLGRMSWLCACLPSDRWAPKIGSVLLLIMGGRPGGACSDFVLIYAFFNLVSALKSKTQNQNATYMLHVRGESLFVRILLPSEISPPKSLDSSKGIVDVTTGTHQDRWSKHTGRVTE